MERKNATVETFRMKKRLLKTIVSIFLIISGILYLSSANAGKMEVIASIVPLGDFCEKIGGERVSVTVLIPPGASPHVFEPMPSTISKINRAKIFVQVGAGLEFWADRLVHSQKSKGLMIVTVSKGLELIHSVSHDHPEREGDRKGEKGSQEGEGNPHIWLDPLLAKKICGDIESAMIKVDPEGANYYRKRLDAYLKELDDLHRDIEKSVKGFRIKKYVTFHPAFTYFARRYGLEEVGIIVESPGREPSPVHLMKIVKAIRQYGIKAVFAEPQFNPRTAEVIAKEADCRVLILDPIGGKAPYGNDYISLMRYNISVMEEAMK